MGKLTDLKIKHAKPREKEYKILAVTVFGMA
jgi:hypothetical protein